MPVAEGRAEKPCSSLPSHHREAGPRAKCFPGLVFPAVSFPLCLQWQCQRQQERIRQGGSVSLGSETVTDGARQNCLPTLGHTRGCGTANAGGTGLPDTGQSVDRLTAAELWLLLLTVDSQRCFAACLAVLAAAGLSIPSCSSNPGPSCRAGQLV